MKTYDYIITLRSRNLAVIDRISEFMLLIVILGLSYTLIVSEFVPASWITIGVIAFVIGWIIFVKSEQKKNQRPYYRRALLVAGVGIWYLFPTGFFIGATYLLAALLEGQAKFPQEIAFDNDNIVFNSLPKRYYRWDEISNVILKDNLLTIDFKNNKLVQKEIESAVSIKEEQLFNDFCKTNLIKN